MFDILVLLCVVFSLCIFPISIRYNADLSTSSTFFSFQPSSRWRYSFPFCGHVYISLHLGVYIRYKPGIWELLVFDTGYCPFCEHQWHQISMLKHISSYIIIQTSWYRTYTSWWVHYHPYAAEYILSLYRTRVLQIHIHDIPRRSSSAFAKLYISFVSHTKTACHKHICRN